MAAQRVVFLKNFPVLSITQLITSTIIRLTRLLLLLWKLKLNTSDTEAPFWLYSFLFLMVLFHQVSFEIRDLFV